MCVCVGGGEGCVCVWGGRVCVCGGGGRVCVCVWGGVRGVCVCVEGGGVNGVISTLNSVFTCVYCSTFQQLYLKSSWSNCNDLMIFRYKNLFQMV